MANLLGVGGNFPKYRTLNLLRKYGWRATTCYKDRVCVAGEETHPTYMMRHVRAPCISAVIKIQNFSPVPVYDFHTSLNFVFSAIGTSWLNTDVESCLDEQKCQRINSQRKQEVI